MHMKNWECWRQLPFIEADSLISYYLNKYVSIGFYSLKNPKNDFSLILNHFVLKGILKWALTNQSSIVCNVKQ